ncbi:hypothetical protein SLE2022_128810 [Rubroshorea leprosula]
MARSCKDAFLQHSWAGRNQKGWQVIWYATIWVLWSTQNLRIFEAKQVSTDEVFHMVQYNSYCWASRNQKGWQVIWYATIWALWSTQNLRLFEAKQVSTDEVFHMVQYNSYCWIKSKIEGWTYSYADWCNAPSRCRIVKVSKLRLIELDQVR